MQNERELGAPLTGGPVDRSVRPLVEETDVVWLRECVEMLWALLDDIDTASDIAKYDDKLYRRIVEKLQGRRFDLVTSDGYDLFVKPNISVTGPGAKE